MNSPEDKIKKWGDNRKSSLKNSNDSVTEKIKKEISDKAGSNKHNKLIQNDPDRSGRYGNNSPLVVAAVLMVTLVGLFFSVFIPKGKISTEQTSEPRLTDRYTLNTPLKKLIEQNSITIQKPLIHLTTYESLFIEEKKK